MADAMSMARLLMDQRKNLEAQAREILDRAESEKRSTLTAEEQTTFDKVSADMDQLRKRADSLVQFEADRAAADEALRAAGHKGPDNSEAGMAEQFRALAAGERRSVEFEFGKDVTSASARALSKGTATAGGNTVPTTFAGRLYEHLIETATLLRMGATVWNTNSGENIDVPITTSHGTAALVAEGGTIAGTDPAFGKRTLGAYKYGEMLYVPNELLTDTGVNLNDYLARQAGRAVGNALGADLVVGNGSSKPSGIFQTSTLGVTGGAGVVGAPTFDNLIDLYYSVIAPYRNSPDAGWLIKDSTAGVLRKLKDSSGRYLWEAAVTPGTPDLILGKPVYTDPNVAATALSAKSVLFGDLSQYVVRLVNGVRFERSDDFKFDTDVVSFRCLIRGDGLLIDQTGAVKHFIGNAA